MKCNVGKGDKIVRIILGVVIIAWAITAQSWWGLVGVVLVATAFMGFCPLYKVCGMKTCSSKAGSCCGGACKGHSCNDKKEAASTETSETPAGESENNDQKSM